VRPPLSLKARAMQWLAQREHSRAELRRKLARAARQREDSVEEGEIDALLDWLVANRHLSEARFVESRVHARQARFGTRRIVQELAQHGAALDADAAERLRTSEFERARTVWSRKFGTAPAADAPARAKQMRFLAGRGFAADVIRRVVRGGSDED
jgi:regulatory protein